MNEANKKIYELAKELKSLRDIKKQAEDAVKDANEKIKDIEEHKLNDLMLNEGINNVNLNDLEISKSLVFRGGYTKHSDPEAFQFLFDTHNEGALKQTVTVDLSVCPRICFLLDEENIPYKVEYSIHHMTLSSIIKELVEAGKFTTEDIDKYSVYVQPQIKVKQKN
jgi:hypothetical protein